ncbi:MAG: PAS domain S-box protein [Bryobacteraceae bacterium]
MNPERRNIPQGAELLSLLFALLVVLFIAILSYRSWVLFDESSERAVISQRVTAEAGTLLSAIKDAETGQRGFLLTGREQYLEPYQNAMAEALAALDRLKAAAVPRPDQAQRVDALKPLVTEKLEELKRTIDLQRSGGRDAALAVVLSDEGKAAMDKIRTICSEIQTVANDRLVRRSEEARTSANQIGIVSTFGSISLFVLLVISTVTIQRGTRRRQQLIQRLQRGEEEIGEARDRLQTTLASIGDAVISTDAEGRIVFANAVAQTLMRRPREDLIGKHLDEAFRIVNEYSRAKVESPVAKVLREGNIVGMANHTVLIASDGTEVPIDDSGAPIRDRSGAITGTVLVFRDITERRRTEETSRLLALVVESSNDAIISKDLNGIVTTWNKGAERIFGYSAEEAIGQPISIIAVPGNNEMPRTLERIKQGERVEHYETLRRAKDGRLVTVSITISPVRDASRRVIGASKIARDITERKKAEELLRLSEAKTSEARDWLQTTIASIGDGVIATDATGKIGFLNPIAQSLTGWTQLEAAGKPLEEIFVISNEETGAVAENPVGKALREGRIVGLANHTRLTAKDGRQIPVDDSAAPIRDAAGKITGVVLVFRDITERKRTEEALQRALRFDEAVMANMGEGLYTVDSRGLVTFMNPAAEELFGWSFEELRGRKMHDMTHHHHPDGTPFPAEECAGLQVLAQGKTLTGHEDVFIRKDGTFFDVVYSSSPLRSGAEILGLAIVFRDVSEHKRAAEELRRSAEELRRANEDLNQFAFAASHDLQEPLRMVTSYSQLLVKGYRDRLDGEAALCVNFITEGTQRMRELLADLLAYTQVNEDDGESRTNLIDLNLIFRKSVENLKTAIQESDAVVAGGQLPSVRGYEPHFLQLLQNLIGNAIKYRGESAPRVHVSAGKSDGVWRLAVADNGIGIEPQYHQMIFGVFKRLHGRTIPGTGIGLAICQRVVDRFGGRIWVESQLNRGATFYCTLPTVREDEIDGR